MAKLKIDILTEYRNYLRRCRFLKIEHGILKSHKIVLYTHRLNYINSLKVTENISRYLKYGGSKEVNFTKLTEIKVDKQRAAITNVSRLPCHLNTVFYLRVLFNLLC